MQQIIDYVKPELLVLIPVLYFIGMGLKKWEFVKDSIIPVILGVCGIILATIWVLATSQITGWQSALSAVFTAIVQGILCSGCSVYANQIYKQSQN